MSEQEKKFGDRLREFAGRLGGAPEVVALADAIDADCRRLVGEKLEREITIREKIEAAVERLAFEVWCTPPGMDDEGEGDHEVLLRSDLTAALAGIFGPPAPVERGVEAVVLSSTPIDQLRERLVAADLSGDDAEAEAVAAELRNRIAVKDAVRRALRSAPVPKEPSPEGDDQIDEVLRYASTIAYTNGERDLCAALGELRKLWAIGGAKVALKKLSAVLEPLQKLEDGPAEGVAGE